MACSAAAIPPSTVILRYPYAVHRALTAALAIAALSLPLPCPCPTHPFRFRQAQVAPGGRMQSGNVKSALPMRQSPCSIVRPSIYKTQKRSAKSTTVRMRRQKCVFLSRTSAGGTEMRDSLASPYGRSCGIASDE